jgi:hypothetical protein
MVQEIWKSLPSFTLLYLIELKNQQVPKVKPQESRIHYSV